MASRVVSTAPQETFGFQERRPPASTLASRGMLASMAPPAPLAPPAPPAPPVPPVPPVPLVPDAPPACPGTTPSSPHFAGESAKTANRSALVRVVTAPRGTRCRALPPSHLE